MDETQYRRRIAHERSLGQAYVGVELDRLCYDLGLDPVETWRRPRAQDQQRRRDRVALEVEQYVRMGLLVTRPESLWAVTSAA